MSCRNSNDTGTFQNSDIPSFEIQTEDKDNPLLQGPTSTQLKVKSTGGGGGMQCTSYCSSKTGVSTKSQWEY